MEQEITTRITTSLIVPFPTPRDKKFIYVLNAKDGKWSPPAGKINLFESFPQAGIREMAEETQSQVIIEYLIGVYYFRSEHGTPVINFSYATRPINGVPRPVRAENIEDIGVFDLATLRQLEREGKIRAGRVNVEQVEDYLAGKRLPPDAVKMYFS